MNDDPFWTWDASYANGGLDEADRAAMDLHLRSCAACTARVAVARRLAALLTLVPESAFDDPQHAFDDPRSAGHPAPAARGGVDAISGARPDPVPDTVLPRLVERVRRERRRRRVAGLAGALVAAACIAGLGVVVSSDRGTGIPALAPAQATAMSAVAVSPINAAAQVETIDTWARVDIWASCSRTDRPTGNYRLIAVSKDGRTVELGTWPAIPGQTAVIRVPTQLHTRDISTLAIVAESGRTVSRLTVTS